MARSASPNVRIEVDVATRHPVAPNLYGIFFEEVQPHTLRITCLQTCGYISCNYWAVCLTFSFLQCDVTLLPAPRVEKRRNV